MSQADHNISDLDAGVVDVVLHVDPLPGGAQQAHKGVAQDGVAQVTDVRSLVGVDAGVLDQGMKMALFFRGIVAGDQLRGCLAVKLAIDVAGAGNGKRCETFQRHQVGDQFPGDRAGRSLEPASQLKGDWQRVLAHLQIGRLLDGDVREFNLVFGLKYRAEALAKKSLLFAIHAKPLIFLPILAERSGREWPVKIEVSAASAMHSLHRLAHVRYP